MLIQFLNKFIFFCIAFKNIHKNKCNIPSIQTNAGLLSTLLTKFYMISFSLHFSSLFSYFFWSHMALSLLSKHLLSHPEAFLNPSLLLWIYFGSICKLLLFLLHFFMFFVLYYLALQKCFDFSPQNISYWFLIAFSPLYIFSACFFIFTQGISRILSGHTNFTGSD